MKYTWQCQWHMTYDLRHASLILNQQHGCRVGYQTLKVTMLNKWIASQNAALRGDENCIELRDRSHLCYKSIINYDLDIANFLVISPQIRYIEVFDLTNPRFNEQIWSVPSDFVKSRFHCRRMNRATCMPCIYTCINNITPSWMKRNAARCIRIYTS